MSSAAASIVTAGLYAVVSNPAQIAAQPDDAAEKRHHVKGGRGFRNPWESFRELIGRAEVGSVMGWFWFVGVRGRRSKRKKKEEEEEEEEEEIKREKEKLTPPPRRKLTGQSNTPSTTPPTVPVHPPSFLPTRTTPKLRATWLGHACFYLEFPSGLRVLFDPVFEPCCAPIALKALQRFTDPPCEIEDLPFVDAVVISHNHYDHLSYPSVQRIRKKFPRAHFFVPLGNKTWFEKSGVLGGRVTELDWWEGRDVRFESMDEGEGGKEEAVSGTSDDAVVEEGTEGKEVITATISALPCQHVSGRGLFDRCKTLWASWSVESGGVKVYFAGDTGYRSVPHLPPTTDDYSPTLSHLPVCPAFSQIGTHRGPFDLGLIPIGAYEPRYIMSPMHANPRDAVNIFLDTKCRRALGMHWGTWVLTEEDVMEPPRKLAAALGELGVERERFGVVDIGGSEEVD
ncbi:Metallo-hydrolase/oxidoreductase [Byssothecium circinans]|uniref:Metallo-hydrolase/oxidoreductase n=1 Tax=Byssothecium circinans TaxID=147558 RepID=A0A6A5TLA3_9PLEO|nr:Metallo-hydrolase/oxidoreductase [Byssothecium circinans]